MRNRFTIFLLTACWSVAQPESYKIQGRVEEYGLGAGIPGVDVVVDRYESNPLSSLTPKTQVATAPTSTAGTFSFQFDKPGTYRVSVQKDGYRLPGSPMDGFNHAAELTLNAATPTRELTFHLARPAQVSGTVIDAETKKPVEGVPVTIGQFGYSAGQRFLIPDGVSATTGPEGRFALPGLVPGAHVIILGPLLRAASDLRREPALKKLGMKDRLLTQFTEKDREAVDMDYDTTYWPGGSSLENAAPLTIPSAANIDLGVLAVRKIAKHRVFVSLAGSACEGVDRVKISARAIAHKFAFATPTLGDVPCGGAALLRAFPPGEYELELTAATAPGKPETTATTKWQMDHAPATVNIPLLPGVDLTGQAIPAEGAKLGKFDALRITLHPTLFGGIRHGLIPVDATGSFKIPNVSIREYRVNLSGLPPTHYLKELRYNGIPVAHSRIQLNSAAPAHSLELVFDDKPASLSGTVTNSDKPAPNAAVVAVPWPAPDGVELFSALLPTTADEKGYFSISGLAPGNYRLLAVPMEQHRSLQKPNEIQRLLNEAETVTLSKSEQKSVRLKF